jgi:hypothetical protein
MTVPWNCNFLEVDEVPGPKIDASSFVAIRTNLENLSIRWKYEMELDVRIALLMTEHWKEPSARCSTWRYP